MLSEGDPVKIETLGGESYYGIVIHVGEAGKHIAICRHEEGDIKAQFDEHHVVLLPNDSLEQPLPVVEVPGTSSGDTIDPTKRTYVDTVATVRGGGRYD